MMPGYAGLFESFLKTGQSPIDLDDRITCPKIYAPLILNGHWLKDGEAILQNNGEKANIYLTGDRIPSTISGGPMGHDVYEFCNAHFHWGEENCRGAEHTINGTWFSMEGHIVHWNRKYLTFEECLKHTDGICILAYLFLVQAGSCDSRINKMESITDNLKYIVPAGSETKIPANCLKWMRLATHCPYYYTYQGSYNTATNPECAIWIVFPLIIPMRPCQTSAFRQLKNWDGEYITSNWRNIQHLKERKIFLACL